VFKTEHAARKSKYFQSRLPKGEEVQISVLIQMKETDKGKTKRRCLVEVGHGSMVSIFTFRIADFGMGGA